MCIPYVIAKSDQYTLYVLFLLGAFGPQLGRPRVDTLKRSRFINMKELRFNMGNQVWRLAF